MEQDSLEQLVVSSNLYVDSCSRGIICMLKQHWNLLFKNWLGHRGELEASYVMNGAVMNGIARQVSASC